MTKHTWIMGCCWDTNSPASHFFFAVAVNVQVLLTWHCERSGALYDLAPPRQAIRPPQNVEHECTNRILFESYLLWLLQPVHQKCFTLIEYGLGYRGLWPQGMSITVNCTSVSPPINLPCAYNHPVSLNLAYHHLMDHMIHGLHMWPSGARDNLEDDGGSMLQEQCKRMGQNWMATASNPGGTPQFFLCNAWSKTM